MARIEYSLKATHAQTRAHNASLVLRALYDLGPISPRRHRPPHRPHPHERRRAGRGPRGRRPGPRGRPRPEHRRQGPDPRRPRRRRPHRHRPRPRRAHVLGRAREPARRAPPPTTRDLDGRDGDAALALVHELIDERPRARRPARSSASASAPRASSIADGTIRWAVNLDWTGPAARRPPARALRPPDRSSPTTAAPRRSRPSCSSGERPAGQPRRDQGRARHRRRPGPRRRASSAATATARARSATSSSSPTAPQCHCGRFGCLETVACGARDPAGGRRGRLPPTIDPPRAGRRGPAWRRARAGASTRAAGRALGSAIANLIGILDVRHIVVHGSVTVLGEPWLDGDPRRGDPPQPRPAGARDPHRRRRQRRGPDAPRRLRAAADQRARPDGRSDDDRPPGRRDRRRPPRPRDAARTADDAPQRPRRRGRHRRHQDRRPRRRPPRAPSSVAPRDPPPWATRTAPPRRSSACLDDALATSNLDRAELRAVGVGVPGRVDPAPGHGHPRGQPRLARLPAEGRARVRASAARSSSRTTPAPPPSASTRAASSATSTTSPTSRSGPASRPGRPRRHAPSRRPRPGRRDRPRRSPTATARLRLRPARLPRGVRLRPGDRPPRRERLAPTAARTCSPAAANGDARAARPRRRRRPPAGLGRPPPRHDLRRRAGRHRRRRLPRGRPVRRADPPRAGAAPRRVRARRPSCCRPTSSRSCHPKPRRAPGAP